jgi:hypothetical protein
MKDDFVIRCAKELTLEPPGTHLRWASEPGWTNGEIRINGWTGTIKWSREDGPWERVQFMTDDPRIKPTWKDIYAVKDIFWEREEAVMIILKKNSYWAYMDSNHVDLYRPREPEFARMIQMK